MVKTRATYACACLEISVVFVQGGFCKQLWSSCHRDKWKVPGASREAGKLHPLSSRSWLSTGRQVKHQCPRLAGVEAQPQDHNVLFFPLTESWTPTQTSSAQPAPRNSGRLLAFACVNHASPTLPRSWVNKVGCMEVLLGPSICPCGSCSKAACKNHPAQTPH